MKPAVETGECPWIKAFSTNGVIIHAKDPLQNKRFIIC
jgi:hypothetical protein